MRIFVAVVPPQKTLDDLEKSQRQLATFLTSGRLVPNTNFHITLSFLGEVAESDLIFVQSALDKLRNLSEFQISVAAISTLRPANIVCAKFKLTDNLALLHQTLKTELENVGFSVENRVFKPHATLIKQYKFDMPFVEVLKSIDVFNKPFTVDRVVLFKSEFTPNGVVYKELYAVELKGSH